MIQTVHDAGDVVMSRYRHNVARHILGVARHCQAGIMHTLQSQRGHGQLRLGFEPYISVLARGDRRLSELADTLGISRQAANQVIDQIESAGYVERAPDPADGRAKRVRLTRRGRRLVVDGSEAAAAIEVSYCDILGTSAVSTFRDDCYALVSLLGEASTNSDTLIEPIPLAASLPRIADHVSRELMRLTIARGHPGLKLSFGQVLALIGPRGGRIQQIAQAQDISKQAVSAVVSELEQLGYLQRSLDPDDARQRVLTFTLRGRALIEDSVASVEELAKALANSVGKRRWQRIDRTAAQLYRGLQLERDVFDKQNTDSLDAIAQRLRHQLGRRDAQALGQLLVASGT
jgi:DNA-binding MarR family transcriptional regulator